MPYYDASDELELQILNRMRDLLEADDLVRADNRYPAPHKIHCLQTDNMSASADIRVSLVFARGDASTAASGTNFVVPTLAIMVQKFCSKEQKDTDDEEAALRVCANITGVIKRVLVSRYRCDPTPLPDNAYERLWDSLTFTGASLFSNSEKGYYVSDTLISLSSYQRNV